MKVKSQIIIYDIYDLNRFLLLTAVLLNAFFLPILKLDAAHNQSFYATISEATTSTQQNQTLMTVNHLKYRIYSSWSTMANFLNYENFHFTEI